MSAQAISLTPSAVARIRALMPGPDAGLRIGLKKGGCAGMEYTMEITDNATPDEICVEQDGARVFLAPMAQMFLIGTEIDYKSSLLESGFDFRNPNVSDACGCGESVSFSIPGR
tara:strand:+ start:334 stop:675 length:342 start_codon:yes stop_codon:yes gene_type:complete